MSDQPFVLFTYSRSGTPDRDRWLPTGIAGAYFEDVDSARQSILDLRNEITKDGDNDWPATDLEEIEIAPLTQGALAALLNEGMRAVVRSRKVVETIL